MTASRLLAAALLLVAVAIPVPYAQQATSAGTMAVQNLPASLQWLGQSAVKITSPGGKVILIDPYLTQNPRTPPQYKDLAALGRIDVILVTHAHPDHLGDAPALARMHKVPLYAPSGLNNTLVALDVLPADLAPGMNKSGTVQPAGSGIKITMVRAEHSSEFNWTNDQTGKKEVHVGGEAAGFIIELENGFKIYHMGDTGLFSDMALIQRYYRPDLILIPIGGHFTMGPKEAAYATRELLKPRFAIPIHYGTNPRLTGTPEEYKAQLGRARTQIITLNPGETVKF